MALVPWKTSALVGCLTILLILVAAQESSKSAREESSAAFDGNRFSLIENLFGKAAKAVVYSGLSFASFASPVLCPLLGHETEQDNTKQPSLFIFNDAQQPNRSVRILADDEIRADLVDYAQFDPSQLTYVLVHGWIGGIDREIFLRAAKNVALGATADGTACQESRCPTNNQRATRHSTSNVIIVDWSEFAKGSLYTATKNTHKVSRRLARMLKQLSKLGGLKPELIHCLGHSLGAHVCGQAAREAFPGRPSQTANGDTASPAAENMQATSRMGRITGLDPGGLCYEIDAKDEVSYTGLKPADALLVDSIYTNRAPFGNKLNLAQYNVRINNGFIQPPCSLWLHPELGAMYFRDAIGFLLGNVIDAQTLACDHYFSTRFAYQQLPATCSYVSYACDSYENFLRGRCGQCSNARQCYSVDFEYQRPNPSLGHYVEQVSTYSSYFAGFSGGSIGGANQASAPLGSVPYDQRRVYHLRTAKEPPYCSMLFRIRVHLSEASEISSFKTSQLKVRFVGPAGRILNVTSAVDEELATSVDLYGPWESADQSNPAFGLGSRTLTALFDLDSEFATNLASLNGDDSPIKGVVVVYDSGTCMLSQTDPGNPIAGVDLDYLSAPGGGLRDRFSRSLRQNEITVVYKCLGVAVGVGVS